MRKPLTLLCLLLSSSSLADDATLLWSLVTSPSITPTFSVNWQSRWHRRDTALPTQPCQAYCDAIRIQSAQHGLPEAWVWAVIKSESNFNPKAVSPKGAKGLMQLMDINSQHYGIDPLIPEENIEGGTALLSTYYQRYQSLPLALAAYNAGPSAVDKYSAIPPYPETQRYVERVLKHIQHYQEKTP